MESLFSFFQSYKKYFKDWIRNLWKIANSTDYGVNSSVENAQSAGNFILINNIK